MVDVLHGHCLFDDRIKICGGDFHICQTGRKADTFVEFVYLPEILFIVIHQQKKQYAKSHQFTVKMSFLDMGEGGQRVVYGMTEARIVVDDVLCGHQDRYDSCRYDDGEYRLLKLVGYHTVFLIFQSFLSI